MARVFSYSEIESGRVPDQALFDGVPKSFRISAGFGVRSEELVGAMIFGSVAVGRANRRSDIDVLISMELDDQQCFEAAKRVVEALKKATKGLVPVQHIFRSSYNLDEGHDEMDRYFGMHLTGPHRIVVGKDPAESMAFQKSPAGKIIDDYAHEKVRKISNGMSADEEHDQLRHIQRLLDLPNAVGRKALRAVDEVESTARIGDDTANKTAVLNAALELFDEHGIAAFPRMLIELDTLYNHVLDDAVDHHTSRKSYDKFLADIASQAPAAVAWLNSVDEEMALRFGRSEN